MIKRTLTSLSPLLLLGLLSTVHAQTPGHEWDRGERPDWNLAALNEVFEYAGAQSSTGVVIVHRGELVAERYWPAPSSARFGRMLHSTTEDGRTLEDVASAQKAVLSFLVSKAMQENLLTPETSISSVLGVGWSEANSDQESQIKVRHLLTMTSGLRPNLTFEAKPDSQWRYNTRAYSQLVAVLESVTETKIGPLTQQWLTQPIGMTESSWQPRPWVADLDANTLGFVTSARDLARFGLLMLREGKWKDDVSLLKPELVAAATTPSLDLNPVYGYLWWLNGVPALRPAQAATRASASDGPEFTATLIPGAPSDLFAGFGALGRKVYVVPSLDLVVTRLGDQPSDRDFDQQFWLKLMKALPATPICQACEPAISSLPSEAKSVDGLFISWREHIIDDPTLGVPDLSGSDGLEMADLDGDGYEDIVSVHESDTVYDGRPVGHVRIAWGTGDPDRWQLTTLASGVDAAAAEDVTIADANGDGHLDILVACELAHLIYFQNPGQQPRSKEWPRVIPRVTRDRGSYIRAFFADFDGDGRPEVSAANKGVQNTSADDDPVKLNISIYHLPADPLDGDSWTEQVLGQVLVPINAEPVDLDGDGDLDVVAGSRREARILWFENRSQEPGEFSFEEHRIEIAGAPTDISITGFNMDYADLNGDGRKDIVSTAWPGTILLLIQPETFDQPWQFHEIGSTPPDQLVSVRLGDIDGDGDLDVFTGGYSRGPREQDGPLVTVNEPLGRIVWFENRTAQEAGSSSAGTAPSWRTHSIARPKRGMYDKWLFRDLDSDGDLDAIGTRGNSFPYDGVIWLEQIRSEKPQVSFQPARRIDSQQMGQPEG